MVSRAIRSAQTQVEAQNFEIRKNVLKYDEVLNRQRTVIYDERRKVLSGADLHEQIRSMLDEVVESYVYAECGEGYPEDWDLEKLWTALKTLYPVGIPLEAVEAEREGLSAEYLAEELKTDAQAAYDRREESLGIGPDGEPVMRELERRVLLSVMDRKWREHLYEMDYLQEGIGLRAMGQRDPLVEYQREGFDMFVSMMDAIKEESVGFLFNVEVQVEQPMAAPDEQLTATGPGEVAGELQVEHLLNDAEPTSAEELPAAPSRHLTQFEGTPAPAPVFEPEPMDQDLPAVEPDDPAPVQDVVADVHEVPLSAEDVVPAAAAPDVPVAPVPPADVQIPAAPQAPEAAAPVVPQAAPETVTPAAPQPPVTGGLPASFGRPDRPTQLQYSAPDERGGVVSSGGSVDPLTGQVSSGGPSRNAPCPCGSGRKYKRCHGDPTKA
jgi:preprotein translocase subunit SecA